MITQAELAFFEFIYERQLIWHKRYILGSSGPWTTDPAMSQFRFCNVYRELDKGSRVLYNQILSNSTMSLEDKLFNTVAYRLFNSTTAFTTTHFKEPLDHQTYHWEYWEPIFDAQNKAGQVLFHKAYIVNGYYPEEEYRRSDKHVQVLLTLQALALHLIHNRFCKELIDQPTAKDQWAYLQQIPMVGPFLAYEVFSDLGYTNQFRFNDNDYVYIGPGAKPALELLYDKLSQKEAEAKCIHLYEIQEEAWSALYLKNRKKWSDIAYRNSIIPTPLLSLGNTEQALCEYRKWLNISKSLENKDFKCSKRKFK